LKPKLDARTAQSFTNLRANGDFKVVLSWLYTYAESETLSCTQQEGNELFRAQGRVAAIKEFFEAVEQSPQLLEKLKANL